MPEATAPPGDTESGPVVVSIEHVSKKFVIRRDKSLKERLVNATRSRRHREDFWALRDVDLQIRAGTTVGLIGPNGSGKSTLLKTIGGILQPTTGQVRRRGRLAALLELGAGFHPDLTGRENVYLNAAILGLSRAQTDSFFDAIVEFSGIPEFIDTQVKFYSSGMYVRLAFAVAVHVDPDVLLVDEVLAVGDEPFQRRCLDRIRTFQAEGRTIVLVTHALDQVVDVCDRAVVLERGNVAFDGPPSDATRFLRGEYVVADEAHLERERQRATSDEGAPPLSGARVHAVRLLDSSGRPVDHLASGAPACFEVDVEVPEATSDLVVGVGLATLAGQGLWGTNTKLMGRRLAAPAGGSSVRIEVEGLHAGPGQYEVHGAVASWRGPEVDRLARGLVLTMDGGDETIGVLGVRPLAASIGPAGG
ncbi:MAG: ABC transporter ATP-binding protein [Kineosporiaceae bacterium]